MPSYSSHHIHLMSHDAMQAAAFYQTMFGARVEASRGANGLPRANMTLGRQFILISTVDESVTHTASGPHSRLGLDHIGIGVDDIQAAATELKAKGAEFTMEPRGPIAFMRGPDNVAIELVQTQAASDAGID